MLFRSTAVAMYLMVAPQMRYRERMEEWSRLGGALQMLLDRWKEPDVPFIRRQYEAVLVTAKRAREEIKLNVALIENFRGFIEQALTAGATAMTDGKGYNRTGQPASVNPMSAVLYQQG